MASPRADSYSAGSGAAIYAGMAAPSSTPTWMSSATVNQWAAALPNSAGAGGTKVNTYSSFCLDPVTLDILIAAAGGHEDWDNRVVKYAAGVNSPTGWELLKATTPLGQVIDDAAYNADGAPMSRHTYDWMVFVPSLRRIFLVGLFGTYSHASAANTIDAFNVDTGQWDPAGTWPYTYGSVLTNLAGTGGVFLDSDTGMLFWDTKRWNPAVGGAPTDLGAQTTPSRMTNAYDPSRQAVFGLQFGNGWASGSGVVAQQTLNPSGTQVKRTISFNASAAFTQFQSDQPGNAALTYDRLRDRFCFAYGATKSGGYALGGPLRLIEITPNAGTTWDMTLLSPSGSVADVAGTSGPCGRFKYIERGGIGGYLAMPDAASGLYFLRTV